jgi:hypothetical protein
MFPWTALVEKPEEQGPGFWGSLAQNPMLPYAGLQLGSSVAGWLGGRGRYNEAEEDFDAAKANLAKTADDEPFDPYQLFAQGRRAIGADVTARGNQVDDTLGLDTGQGQGALWGELLKDEYGMAADLFAQRDLEKYRRKGDVASQLFTMAGNRLGGV